MKYQFKCKNCDETVTIEEQADKITGKVVICPKCSNKMNRVWKAGFVVPDYMHDVTDINKRLKHSRPSGKSKVIF